MGDEVGLDVAVAHVLEYQARRFEVAHAVLPPRRDERDEKYELPPLSSGSSYFSCFASIA